MARYASRLLILALAVMFAVPVFAAPASAWWTKGTSDLQVVWSMTPTATPNRYLITIAAKNNGPDSFRGYSINAEGPRIGIVAWTYIGHQGGQCWDSGNGHRGGWQIRCRVFGKVRPQQTGGAIQLVVDVPPPTAWFRFTGAAFSSFTHDTVDNNTFRIIGPLP